MEEFVRLANLIAKLYIARSDVKAIQVPTGEYFTHVANPGRPPTEPPIYLPWKRADLIAHLEGKRSFGHYLLDKDNTCKLFALDIDLTDTGNVPQLPLPWEEKEPFFYDESHSDTEKMAVWENSFMPDSPRKCWQNRAHPARGYLKACMRTLADILEKQIRADLNIPTAVAYSGSKGIHVYGFTGRIPATEVREGMHVVLEALPLSKVRGNVIWGWNETIKSQNMLSPDCFTIETFPKQDTLSEGGFGNLMRLPLGKNLKSKDPTFFIDTSKAPSLMLPADPIEVLEAVAEELG